MFGEKKRVLMIDNYDSFTWNLYQYLCQSSLCEEVQVWRNDKIDVATIEKEIRPDIIFISPGPGHPHSDSGVSREVITHFQGKLPIFGVCMGLQCIFDVFGGDVSYAGEIVHGKTTTIKHDGKGMFLNVPQSVAVTRYHSLAGAPKTLPECLEVTATTETSPTIIMGVRHKKYVIEGVQFHPESILTECGQLMVDNLLSVNGGTWDHNNQTSFSSGGGKENILAKIYKQRQEDYSVIEQLPGKSFELLQVTHSLAIAPELINFYDRLVYTQKTLGQSVILSEFKRASPSKGIINIKAHPATQALTYAINGCSAISVLTEPKFFKGSLEDLEVVRKVIDTPNESGYTRPAVLRKEFIFSKYQILESRLAGADTVLLIVKMLDCQSLLQELYSYSLSLGMVPLVEVNDEPELKSALSLTYEKSTKEPLIIGVNNRNLTSFSVDLNTTSSLVDIAKQENGRIGDVLVLALSGITRVNDVEKYKYQDKVDGFLIGESLMRAQEQDYKTTWPTPESDDKTRQQHTKMDAASVRIDSTLLEQYQGKLVRILGKCESFDPSSNHATLISNGNITLISSPGDTLNVNKNYEIIGKVGTNDVNVRVLSAIEVSDNLNMEHVQKLVQYVHKVPELFY